MIKISLRLISEWGGEGKGFFFNENTKQILVVRISPSDNKSLTREIRFSSSIITNYTAEGGGVVIAALFPPYRNPLIRFHF